MKNFILKNSYLLLLTPIYYFVITFFYTWPLLHYYNERQYSRLIFPLIFSALLAYGSIKAFRLYQKRKEHSQQALINETETLASNSSPTKALIISLRKRARNLRRASWVTLFFTFVSIAFGLYVFTTAGAITQRDTFAARLEEEQYYSKEYDRRTLDKIYKLLSESNDSNTPILLDEIKKIETQMDDNSKRLEEQLRRRQSESAPNQQLLFFLSTTATRLGSVLLLIFLVQILLSVYRYSIRLVSYYEARADALLLYDGSNAEQLQTLVAVLAAERIEFGKSPSTPVEQAAELLKSAASLRK